MRQLGLAVLVLLVSGCTPEPLYNGKPLSYWKQELLSKDPPARWRAAATMREVGPRARVAIPELIECLHDDEFRIVFNAATALGNIGPDAREAVPELIKLQSHPVSNVREAAAEALKKIDADTAQEGVK